MDLHRRTGVSKIEVVRPEGELDVMTAPRFRDLLRQGHRRSTGAPRLIVDLGAVTFMDCAALRELCDAQAWAVEQGGWLRVVHAQRGIATLFTATRLTGRFPRYATVRDARCDQMANCSP
ncbi:STAS domain-containing protein [Streptomyces albofaciens]|uniref:STAS domain-containing protein n=1 Tax=Streptomyces albofaciens TaxID=66866 RepID=UPI001FCB3653|nr:STAS domain-containing protein [Streptomyces albofaciens]